jgi:hypothetical protein
MENILSRIKKRPMIDDCIDFENEGQVFGFKLRVLMNLSKSTT